MRNRKRYLVAIGAILTFCILSTSGSTPGSAEEKAPPAPTEKKQIPPEEMGQMEEMMIPMMGKMMEVMFDTMLQALAKPESAQKMATFTKNYYDALLAKGFTKEEALK